MFPMMVRSEDYEFICAIIRLSENDSSTFSSMKNAFMAAALANGMKNVVRFLFDYGMRIESSEFIELAISAKDDGLTDMIFKHFSDERIQITTSIPKFVFDGDDENAVRLNTVTVPKTCVMCVVIDHSLAHRNSYALRAAFESYYHFSCRIGRYDRKCETRFLYLFLGGKYGNLEDTIETRECVKILMDYGANPWEYVETLHHHGTIRTHGCSHLVAAEHTIPESMAKIVFAEGRHISSMRQFMNDSGSRALGLAYSTSRYTTFRHLLRIAKTMTNGKIIDDAFVSVINLMRNEPAEDVCSVEDLVVVDDLMMAGGNPYVSLHGFMSAYDCASRFIAGNVVTTHIVSFHRRVTLFDMVLWHEDMS